MCQIAHAVGPSGHEAMISFLAHATICRFSLGQLHQGHDRLQERLQIGPERWLTRASAMTNARERAKSTRTNEGLAVIGRSDRGKPSLYTQQGQPSEGLQITILDFPV
jgi:hypothetical protein